MLPRNTRKCERNRRIPFRVLRVFRGFAITSKGFVHGQRRSPLVIASTVRREQIRLLTRGRRSTADRIHSAPHLRWGEASRRAAAAKMAAVPARRSRVPRDPTRCAVGFPTVSMFKVRPKDKVVLESCLGCFLLPRNPAILLRLGGARHQAQRERSPFANRRSSKMPAGTDPSRAAVNHRHTNRKAFRHQTSNIGVPSRARARKRLIICP